MKKDTYEDDILLKIETEVFDFFVRSHDFNGMPLRQVSGVINIPYEDSIDFIIALVEAEKITIQSSTNPHIIGFKHYPIDAQIKILTDAKTTTVEEKKIGSITLSFENTEFPICLYPSKKNLIEKRHFTIYANAPYTRQLAAGNPHLEPIFFEVDVLERYFSDPRYNFNFDDYSGKITCAYDEEGIPILKEEDQVFVKTFGLGFDLEHNRLAAVYRRYLADLSDDHQLFWRSKEFKGEARLLQEYYDNTINGSWTFSHSIFSAFIAELDCLNELSQLIFSENLFVKSFGKENRPKEFTFFLTPTLKNYNDFVLLLDKMISDNINKNFFKGKIELFRLREISPGIYEKENKGTLQLFEEWLSSLFKVAGEGSLADVFAAFKKIRRERQNPAHRISENIYDKAFFKKQTDLVQEAYNSMRQLRNIFHQHKKARSYTIPKWLESGEIKTF